MSMGRPPSIETLRIMPPWKNPTHRPSGEKNGLVASPPELSARNSRPSSSRTRIVGRPFTLAVIASLLPSGDTSMAGQSPRVISESSGTRIETEARKQLEAAQAELSRSQDHERHLREEGRPLITELLLATGSSTAGGGGPAR